ncbi:MAG TPA: TonB family protein [Allosphingosinicella sp.]|nr:TonB family protein [Allosphingosinicella sp.]
MMEGAFYQQKKTSPTALAVVVLMHGAALTALALAKTEVFTDGKIPPTIVDFIKDDPPPPPLPPEPVKSEVPPPPSVVTHVPPIVEMPPQPIVVRTDPLPPTPTVVATRAEPVPTADPTPRADPPPAPVREIKPARARANLASYVSDEDYPSAAVRNEEQGTTRFKLVVGADGRVQDCTVTGSSGSSALDSTTCKLMRQRAKFAPATGTDGKPTSDTVTNAIRWVLPAD